MKRSILALIAVVTVAGCTTHRADMRDLNYFQPDCARRDEQMRWLVSQLPTQNEYFIDRMVMTSPEGVVITNLDGTYKERNAVASRKYQAVILSNIDYLNRYCPPPKARPANCVTVREDMTSGSAVGKRCYSAKNPKPVINRWEPLVD